MPNEVDCVMKDWWQVTSLQEHLIFMFLFSIIASFSLMTALLQELWFACFCGQKLLTTTETINSNLN